MNAKEYLQSLIDSMSVSDRKVTVAELKLLQRLTTLDKQSPHYAEVSMKIGDLFIRQVISEQNLESHIDPAGYFTSVVNEAKTCILRAYNSQAYSPIRVSVESLNGRQLNYALGLAMNTGQPVKLHNGVVTVGDSVCDYKVSIDTICKDSGMQIEVVKFTAKVIPATAYRATLTTPSGEVICCSHFDVKVATARCYIKAQLGPTVLIPLEIYNHV